MATKDGIMDKIMDNHKDDGFNDTGKYTPSSVRLMLDEARKIGQHEKILEIMMSLALSFSTSSAVSSFKDMEISCAISIYLVFLFEFSVLFIFSIYSI